MIKSLITKGILNDGEIVFNTYELPLSIELGISEFDLDIIMDKEIVLDLTINNPDIGIDII